MFPNVERLGVELTTDEAVLRVHIHELARNKLHAYFPNAERQEQAAEQSDTEEEPDTHLGLDDVDMVVCESTIALSCLQSMMQVQGSEYKGCVQRGTEVDKMLANDLDEMLDDELQDAIRIQKFRSDLITTSEQSRARFARDSVEL